MNGHQETLPDEPPSGEQLLAYLDGELDPASRQQIDSQLSQSVELRQRLKEHQQTWDLLDELPRATVDDSFTRTTVEMVALRADDLITRASRTRRTRQRLLWGGGLTAAIIAGLLGYFAMAHRLDEPNVRLVEDLPIIEHLDAYRNADSIDFLRQLDDQKLFHEGERP